MNIQQSMVLVLLIALPTAIVASPPPVARPLHVVAKSADAVVSVYVKAASVDENAVAHYEINFDVRLRGSINQSCLNGPAGLKAGRKYLLFLNSAEKKDLCGNLKIAGVSEPAAFEIEENQNGDYLVLDNRAITHQDFQTPLKRNNLQRLMA